MLQLLPLLLLLSTGHCAKRSTHDFSSSFPQPCRVSIPGPIMKRREDSERLTDLPGSHSWWTGERGMCAQLALFPPRSQMQVCQTAALLARFGGHASPLDSSLIVSKKKVQNYFRPSDLLQALHYLCTCSSGNGDGVSPQRSFSWGPTHSILVTPAWKFLAFDTNKSLSGSQLCP